MGGKIYISLDLLALRQQSILLWLRKSLSRCISKLPLDMYIWDRQGWIVIETLPVPGGNSLSFTKSESCEEHRGSCCCVHKIQDWLMPFEKWASFLAVVSWSFNLIRDLKRCRKKWVCFGSSVFIICIWLIREKPYSNDYQDMFLEHRFK